MISQLLFIEDVAVKLGKSIDHIVPLQGKIVSGLHIPDNLQTMDLFENISKGNKFIKELGLARTQANKHLSYDLYSDSWVRECS